MNELDKDTYILGMWLIIGRIDGFVHMDHLFSITRDKTDFFKWDIFSRTRIYKDDKMFDSDDIKKGVNFSVSGTEDDIMSQLLININEAKDMMQQGGIEPELKSILIKGNVDKLIELSKDCDFIHTKVLEKEEFNTKYGTN